MRRARIYDFIRTVHLERLADSAPADFIYHRTRYDFDTSLLPRENPPRQLSRFGIVLHLLRTPYDVAELNEPLHRSRWWDLLGQVAAMRLRSGWGARRTVIGAYCISPDDPVEVYRDRKRLPPKLDAIYCRLVINLLVRQMDRLALGTDAAREALVRYVPPAVVGARAKDFAALPAPCDCLQSSIEQPEPDRLLFVGSFDQRKGIRMLMAAWGELGPADASRLRLHLIGKGELAAEVAAWAAGRDNVELQVDPPRPQIHRAYRRASVVVMLSQRSGRQREQVGLPIVEGLSHGCRIVTTTETGLAGWLEAHGHDVVDPHLAAAPLAERLVAAVARADGRAAVLATLPARDSRIDADRWLMAAP